MTDEWIQSHSMDYLMAMIRLRVHRRKRYVKGACNYITKHPSMAESLDYPILVEQYQQKNVSLSELKTLFMLNTTAAVSIIKELADSENPSDVTVASELITAMHLNPRDYPSVKEKREMNEIWFLVNRSKTELRDSGILGLTRYWEPRSLAALYYRLEQLYGGAYHLCKEMRSCLHIFTHNNSLNERVVNAREAALMPNPHCYQMPEETSISFINNLSSFYNQFALMMQERVLGWDCEWFTRVGVSIPDTIQIAGAYHTWIVDGIWLGQEDVMRETSRYWGVLVNNSEIFHVFKGTDDVRLLMQYTEIPEFGHIQNVINLDSVAVGVGFRTQASLSRYALLTLGSPLDKCMRMSDWSQRPLEWGQLFYAAQDAYVTRKTYVIMARWIMDNVDDSEIKENITLLRRDFAKEAVGNTQKDDSFTFSIRASKELRNVIHNSVQNCVDYYSVC